MGNDRVCPIYDCRIVTAFVEHTHVYAQYVSHVYGTSHAPFIRADNHGRVFADVKVWDSAEQSFDKLIDRLYGIKTFQRDSVLHTWVMGVKRDDIVYTHMYEFLKRQGAVQRLASGAFVLSAFI